MTATVLQTSMGRFLYESIAKKNSTPPILLKCFKEKKTLFNFLFLSNLPTAIFPPNNSLSYPALISGLSVSEKGVKLMEE